MTSLWDTASHDHESEALDRQLIAAREASAQYVGFLFNASSKADYSNRLALIEDKLDSVAQAVTGSPAEFAVIRAKLAESLDHDFEVLAAEKQGSKMAESEGKFRAQVKSDDGEKWVDGGLFTNREDAEADAARLGEEHGNETRVVEGSKKVAVSLTRVRLHDKSIGDSMDDGAIFVGVDGSGNEVFFQASPEDAKQLVNIMTSDLGINFSGVDIDESDIVSEGRKKAAKSCPRHADVGGSPLCQDCLWANVTPESAAVDALNAEIGDGDINEWMTGSKTAGSPSDVCPECGAHMDDVMVYDDRLVANCDSCGWSGTKRKKTAGAFDSGLGYGFMVTQEFDTLSDNDKVILKPVEVFGPNNISEETRAALKEGAGGAFQLWDDDGLLMASGRWFEGEGEGDPLYDYGEGMFGATRMTVGANQPFIGKKTAATKTFDEWNREETKRIADGEHPDIAKHVRKARAPGGMARMMFWDDYLKAAEREGFEPETSVFGSKQDLAHRDRIVAENARRESSLTAYFAKASRREAYEDAFKGGVPSPRKMAERHTDSTTGIVGEWRVDVAGVGESTWSNNAVTWDTEEEAKRASSDLMSRWMGADMARVVPSSTPKGETVDTSDPYITENWRKSGSLRKKAEGPKWRVEFIVADGSPEVWYTNAMRYDTEEEAAEAARRKADAWMLVVDWRVVTEDTPEKQALSETGPGNWGQRSGSRRAAYRRPFVRTAEFIPTHEWFTATGPTGFVPVELIEGNPLGPEGSIVRIRLEDGTTTEALGEMVVPLKTAKKTGKTWQAQWATDRVNAQAPLHDVFTPIKGDDQVIFIEADTQDEAKEKLRKDFNLNPWYYDITEAQIAGQMPMFAARKMGSRIDALRAIVQNKQHGEVDGQDVDLFTASGLVQVFDALSPENQEKFETLPFSSLVTFMYQHATGSKKTADASDFSNPDFMAGFRAGSADARTQPSMNSSGANMVPYGHSIPEGASDKFRKGYSKGYQSATDVHMGQKTAADLWAYEDDGSYGRNAMGEPCAICGTKILPSETGEDYWVHSNIGLLWNHPATRKGKTAGPVREGAGAVGVLFDPNGNKLYLGENNTLVSDLNDAKGFGFFESAEQTAWSVGQFLWGTANEGPMGGTGGGGKWNSYAENPHGYRTSSKHINDGIDAEFIRTWLLTHYLVNNEQTRAVVECIVSQTGEWEYLDARAERGRGMRSGDDEWKRDVDDMGVDHELGMTLSGLYEGHDGPHLPTCPEGQGLG